jgi:GNAT superfamily N-acetyltransferase
MKEGFTIREAVYEDLPALLNLIIELATYEKAPDAVIVELPTFRQYFKEGRFQALVALDEDKLVAMALYYEAYSTWKGKIVYLDDMVVTQAYRRKGIGEQLFNAMIRKTWELGCKQMRWHVLDWNQPAINFYKKYKAHLDPEWILGKFELEDLERLSKEIS